MARGFRRRTRDGQVRYVATLEGYERALVADSMRQVVRLLAAEPLTGGGEDEFARIVAGFGSVTDGSRQAADVPEADQDPAVRRLLPAGSPEDPEASAEYRRLTEAGLRRRKSAALERSITVLGGDDDLRLDAQDAQQFVAALTDVRLVLGERLGLRTDEDLDALEAAVVDLDEREPMVQLYALYDFLTWLQETLASALLGDS